MMLPWISYVQSPDLPYAVTCGTYSVKSAHRKNGVLGWYIRWHDVSPNRYINVDCQASKGGTPVTSVWFETREEAMDVAQLHHDNKDNM